MAHYLTEFYTAKPAWLALSEDQRQQFFAGIGSAMPTLQTLGIEPVAVGKIDPSKPHSAQHMFFAIWRCPDEPALNTLVDSIAQSGWHDYFDTINGGGEGTDLMRHLAQLAELN